MRERFELCTKVIGLVLLLVGILFCLTTTASFLSGFLSGLSDWLHGVGWRSFAIQIVLLGIIPSLGVTSAGVIQVRSLPGAWKGRCPGIFIPELSAVTFDSRPLGASLAYEGIGPFPGSSLPTLGLCSLQAAATTFGIVIGCDHVL